MSCHSAQLQGNKQWKSARKALQCSMGLCPQGNQGTRRLRFARKLRYSRRRCGFEDALEGTRMKQAGGRAKRANIGQLHESALNYNFGLEHWNEDGEGGPRAFELVSAVTAFVRTRWDRGDYLS